MEKDEIKRKKIRDEKRKELKLSKSKQNSQKLSHSRSTYSPSQQQDPGESYQQMNPQPLSSNFSYEGSHNYEGGHQQDQYFPPQQQQAPIIQKDPLPLEVAEDIWGAPTEQQAEEQKKPASRKYYGRVEFGEEIDDDFSHAPPDAKTKNSFRQKLSKFALREKITEPLKYPEKQPIDFIVNSVCDALDFQLHKGRVIGALMECNLKKMAMMQISEDLEDIVQQTKCLGSVGKQNNGTRMTCFWLIKKADLKKVLKKYPIFDSYMDKWTITETTRKKEVVKCMWQYWGDKVKAKEYSSFKLILL